jgi:site-specific recombinase XerD
MIGAIGVERTAVDGPLPHEVVDYLSSLEARGASTATLRAYRGDLTAYCEWLAERDRTPLTAERTDLRAWSAHLAERGLSPATRARRLSAIRGLHRRIATTLDEAADPAAELPGPRRKRRLPAVPRPRTTAALLDDPWPDDPLGNRDRAVLELLYGAGLRAAEACDLDLEHLEATAMRVTGKGGRTRIVPLGAPARSAIETWLAQGRHLLATADSPPALFLTNRGTRLEPSAVRRLLQRRLRALGLEGFSPHALRHAYATDMLEGGGDLRSIQDLLGHASLDTTEVYTHLGLPHLRDAHARAHPRGG